MVVPSGPAFHYLKVKNHLREGIASGRWRPGERLPSEAELTEAFGLSRMTVNRALRELHQEGLVERVQGVGSFVAQLHRIASTLTVRDVHDEIAARGHQHEAQVHLLESVAATEAQAAEFQLQPGAPLFHSIIVHRDNGVAVQCEDRLVNPACAPEYMAQDFTQVTPTHYLLEVAPLSEARYTIEAQRPSPLEAKLLGMPRGEPCLVVRRCTLSLGQVVTAVRLTHPGGRWMLQGSFQA
ncbi:histidine utilization repressor [Roseateles terrae]|uniref:Histidine utilization repressor n=1 Tax=Roseateles terrae TaxID=431060 RepID=A0ABR6GQM9_9BURK|nr:histidine utilization repressor [Roseateles terrae]MBB3194418.1 GntR family histidine utilization transcriptional repressor [Roseateles terrae]OWQ88245.1 histidine utilization repressor [Roseateles terrae]